MQTTCARAAEVLASAPLDNGDVDPGQCQLAQLSDNLVFFSHTAPPLATEQAEQLGARDIRVVEGRVVGLEMKDDHLTGVRLESGMVVARQALVVGAPMVARSEMLASLGLAPVEHPFGLGQFIRADPTGQTDAPGVWAT